MQTKIIKLGEVNLNKLVLSSFNENIPVVLPTETVYGLAAPINNEKCIYNIFTIKHRPHDNPLIVHISDMDQLFELIEGGMDPILANLTELFWPGPLTVLFKKSSKISSVVTADSEYVAVRMPAHPTFQQIIKEAKVPLVAPSANISGKPSATNAMDAFEDLNGKVKLIVDGGSCQHGIESTVVYYNPITSQIKILRHGAITSQELAKHCEVSTDQSNEAVPSSPGSKYKHYAPKAEIKIFEPDKHYEKLSSLEAFFIFIALDYQALNMKKFVSETDLQHNLYGIFRECDRQGFKQIFIERPKNEALLNRINMAMLN